MKQVLFITGGNGDIGKKIVEHFKENGYFVISPTSAEMDCSDEKSIDNFIDALRIERIDAIIHCAGWNYISNFEDLKLDLLIKAEMINSLSLLKIVQKLSGFFIPGKSKIIGIASLYGIFSRKGRLAYTSSKHSLNGIVKELAIELGPRNVLINSVTPGFIKTRMTSVNNSIDQINDISSRIPQGRLGEPVEVAKLCWFLCSDDNTYVNGQNIIIDGGYSIGGFQK